MKRGDSRPATVKLGKLGTALQELRSRLRGEAQVEDSAKSRAPPNASAAPASTAAEDRAARQQLQERLVREAEKARLAANPALKPSWSVQSKRDASASKADRKRLRDRLLLETQQARAAALAVARGRLIQEQSAAEVEQSSRPTPQPDPIAERKQIAARLKGLLATATPAVETHVSQVCKETTVAVQAAVERGASIWSARPERDLDGYIVGLDLGTSSVKCAYRQPYRAGDLVRCLSVPLELRSLGHACLWQTVLWFQPQSQTFALTPSEGAVALDGFKSGLIRDQGRARARDGIGVSKAEAMTAFIALNLAHVIGAYALQRPLGPSSAEHYLSINIGIPVAAHDDSVTRGTYERMVSAARDLAAIATELTLSDVRSAYDNAPAQVPDGMQLIPELVAAMSAYAADPTAPDGAHILVDVGASTLDIVAFNLLHQRRISVFTASVEMLGAAALEHVRTTGISDREFKTACDDAFEQVYGGARKKAPSLFHPGYRKRYVQLIKTGGGCRTSVHDQFIAEMPKERVLGEVPVFEPQPPSDITHESCDRSRLLLAYGLTRDAQELLATRLPSEIDDLPPPLPTMPEPIGPEHM